MPPDWWGAPQALLWLLTHWRGGLEGRIVAGLTLGAVGLALAAAAGSWLVYRTEAEDVRAGRAAGAAAYRRYVRGSGAFAAIALVLLLVAPLWILFIVPELPLVEPHGANILYDGLSLFVWWIVYDLLSQGLVATRARTVLLGAPERVTGGLARSGARVVLLWLPCLAVTELLGVSVVLGWLDWLAILGAAGALTYVGVIALAVPVYTVLAPTAPLERTAWAPLTPRTAAWAALAGVRIWDVRVVVDGGADGAALALGWRRPTLFVSARLLAAMDWRQRDALVAMLLGLARQRRRRLQVAALRFGAAAAIAGGVLPIVAWRGTPPVALALSAPLLIFVGLALWLVVIPRRQVRLTLAADRYAVALTGDPLALMVALHTRNVLEGKAPERLSTTRAAYDLAPARQRRRAALAPWERIGAVYVLSQEPGPRASWADQPVPAAVSYSCTSGCAWTVPLDDAPPPEPVPAVRWGTAHGEAAGPEGHGGD